MTRASDGPPWWGRLVARDSGRLLFHLLRDLQPYLERSTAPKTYEADLEAREHLSALLWALGVGEAAPDARKASQLYDEGLIDDADLERLPYDLIEALREEEADAAAATHEAAAKAGTEAESE